MTPGHTTANCQRCNTCTAAPPLYATPSHEGLHHIVRLLLARNAARQHRRASKKTSRSDAGTGSTPEHKQTPVKCQQRRTKKKMTNTTSTCPHCTLSVYLSALTTVHQARRRRRDIKPLPELLRDHSIAKRQPEHVMFIFFDNKHASTTKAHNTQRERCQPQLNGVVQRFRLACALRLSRIEMMRSRAERDPGEGADCQD